MRRIAVSIVLLLFCGASIAQEKTAGPKGRYFGNKPSGKVPEKFNVPLLDENQNPHSSPLFSPDGKEMFITLMNEDPTRIKYSRINENGVWSPLKNVPFSSNYDDANPFLSADGSKLFFKSYRPYNEGQMLNALWVTEKTSNGWSEAKLLDRVFINPGLGWHASVSKKGSVYFAKNKTEEDIDVFYSELKDGRYSSPRNLGTEVNSNVPDWQPCIAPDESYLIFASNKRPGGYGWGDLYVTFKKTDGTWTKAKNLGNKINTKENEDWPLLSPDGKYLFFKYTDYSNNYKWQFKWVSIEVLHDLKPMN